MRYLSPEWMASAGRALSADPALAAAAADLAVVLEQVVTGVAAAPGGPDHTVTWHVVLDRGAASLRPGPAPQADVRFTADHATAAAIAAGRLGAQRAFVEGRLRVGGDLSQLRSAQRALAAVGDALAGVRAATEFPPAATAQPAGAGRRP